MEKPPRTPLRIAVIAGAITLLATMIIGAVLVATLLPKDRDPEKVGEASAKPALILSVAVGGIAYMIASKRRR